MKHVKLISLFAVIVFALSCILFLKNSKADVVKSKYFNYVEKGAKVVKTSPSTQYKLMETYPQSTVTVYNVGTTDLASIWSDRDGLIIKANPFTADVDSFYYFYVDCGKYDIKFSGTGVAFPYTYGDVAICGSTSTGTGNVSTLGGTEDFITKFTSSTSIGDSSLYNPSNVQAGSSILFGWTADLPTDSLDVAIGRDSSRKLQINSGTVDDLVDLTLHRIEPIPTSTIPGLNFGTIANDPSAPVLGDCWYNTSLSAFRCFIGTTVTLSTGNGITSINALTAAAQFLVVGTSGSDFNIVSSTATHTFNLPDAGLTARGVVNTTTQTFNGDKTIDDTLAISTNIANSFIYSNSLKRIVTTLVPTNGQLLIGSTGAAPTVANITGDSNIAIINSAGGIQITCITCGASGGTIINPTDSFIPYRSNATTFLDSRVRRESTNVTAITGGLNTPQSLYLYDSDNIATTGHFTRLEMTARPSGSNVFELFSNSFAESPLEIQFGVAGATQRLILGTGGLRPTVDRAYDLGGGGSLQFDELFIFAVEMNTSGALHWGNRAKLSSPVDGVVEIEKSASVVGASNGTMRFISIRPSVISGDQNNYTIATNTKYVELDASGDLAINGFTTTPTQVDGQEHILINISTHNITIPNESLSATAENRFITTTGLSIVLAPKEAVRIWYSPSLTSRWRAFKWQ